MSERLEPQHDFVLMRQINHEDKTESGLIMPKAGDYTHLKTEKYQREHSPDRDIQKSQSRNMNRYTVLAVGPGSYVDVADDIHDSVFLRKPMAVAPGQVVLVNEGAKPVPVNGEILYMCHDFEVLAVIVTGEDGKETLDPKHDYIFFKQAESMQKTKSGIYIAGEQDATGNQALPDRYEVLGVGDGPWALRQERGKIPEFARRPMAVGIGDIFTFEGNGFIVSAAGAKMGVVQNYQVAAKFVQEAA